MAKDRAPGNIATNKRARHEYTILRTYEAGIVLVGTEVKSLRAGYVSLSDAFAQELDGEIMLYGVHIAEWGFGSWTNHQPRRTRKLLLHRVEIARILDKVREDGLTLVPLAIYFKDGWAKVELALARGRRSPSATPTARSRGRSGATSRVLHREGHHADPDRHRAFAARRARRLVQRRGQRRQPVPKAFPFIRYDPELGIHRDPAPVRVPP